MAAVNHTHKLLHRNGAPELCRVAPHPDIVLRRAQQQANAQVPLAAPAHHGAPTGTKPGLNDGTIFPRSYFDNRPSAVPTERRMPRAALERAPLRGAIRVIAVLVDFSDKVMLPATPQRIKDLFFSTGRKVPTGSVTEYYTEVSGDAKISICGEVVGPYRMPNTLAYYANHESGFSDNAPNLQTLASDALKAVIDAKVNLDSYDNDGNGFVDAFMIVHAGRGAEETDDKNGIWSAKWVLPNDAVKVGNVKVYGFLTIPEDAQLGVCAHELGHLLFGWPDFYDTDYSSAGIGEWCLMSGGSWGALPNNPAGTTPCHPSAWCKANQKWAKVVVDTGSKNLSLQDVKAGPKEVHRLWKGGDQTSKEYFLIENRGKTGFDQSLVSSGLFVWHIDDTQTSNANENHPWVGLMQADRQEDLKNRNGRSDAGDLFPGTKNNRTFNSTSTPSSKAYSDQDSGVSIKNISAAGSTMTMVVSV